MSSLAEKIQKANTTPEKKAVILKKTATINSVFTDTSLSNMAEYMIRSYKDLLINDAIRSLKHCLGDTWFSILYTEDFSKHLSASYDVIAQEVRSMAIGNKVADYSDLEGILTPEGIEEYKASHSTEYTFDEVKEHLVLNFGEATDKAINTLLQFRI